MAVRQRKPRLKLPEESYAIIKEAVLERDGWRCQGCGAMGNLQVHHIRRRSQLGDDVMRNLITLCVCCHGKCHRMKRQ